MGRGTFGLVSSRARGRGGPSRGGSSSRGSFRGRGRGRGGFTSTGSNVPRDGPAPLRDEDGTALEERFQQIAVSDGVDAKLGFERVQEGPSKEGWLVNMHPTTIEDSEWPSGKAAVDFYFIQDDGRLFKATMQYEPYFIVACKSGSETSVEEWLIKKYEGILLRVTREQKEDLGAPNHLLADRRLFLQLVFRNVSDLLAVRREIMPLALANGAKLDAVDAYAEVVQATRAVQLDGDAEMFDAAGPSRRGGERDPRECIIDVREYDVPYYLRVAIDKCMRVGLWYTVAFDAGTPSFTLIKEKVKRADPVVMAYDIETTKAPLKFPDSAVDQVMMISYMVDGQGYLITNREIVSEDIANFEYTPREGYEGPFIIFNEADEAATLKRFFSHIRDVKPTVVATFNGDFFDFPFLDARAKAHGLDLFLETGFARDREDEYKSRCCVHMDCFRWVKRDSYLPQGSQGLKAVTTAKLGYNPIELDPELMTPYAVEQPQVLAQYSVSDAVATYYLYMKYVHPFIFSLCTIIPLCPDEVLRKGSGTLCETLLMVEAYENKIIMPNKHADEHGNMYEGHLLATETYVGGHVEALEAGVFRADIPTHFRVDPTAAQELIDQLDAALKFCITEESKANLEDVTNYDHVKSEIQTALESLRDEPHRTDKPLIYHLDVAAMYPNIMLSNRLQPDSMVTEADCAVCDYNRPGKACDRRLTWAWRGEFFPARRDEYNMIRHALDQESFPPRRPGGPPRKFADLGDAERTALLHKRLGDYSRKVYKKTKDTRVEHRESIVCQRENPFYIDTVRRFRDRRYEYKGMHKTWKKNLDAALGGGKSLAEVDEAKKMIVLYDSLQLAHKCILNSFYGYVMRKGARWHSMEMAGITCLTGATIIQMARALVERVGRPLELDTDGIWCMLPGAFPENFKFTLASGKSIAFSYPCTMLNHLVHAQFTNDQYHDLNPETGLYDVHAENSIFFELDGPYRAMILPSSKEEDKLLKKRYAVFNDDGSLAELKGFEVKRRGELQLIKIFQSQIFERFLLGGTLEACYAAVAEVADRWLDVLYSEAADLADDELVELIAENRSMSKTLAEYAGQKSTSISTARRLAEFLGDGMIKDKGLACKFIISRQPVGAPVTERAVPVAIFSAEEGVKRTYLRRWLKDPGLAEFELRGILDWDYYIERLGSVIQKLITIPAAMQKVSNPVPRIHHPDWLHRRVLATEDHFRQRKMTDFFGGGGGSSGGGGGGGGSGGDTEVQTQLMEDADMEDFGDSTPRPEGAPRIAFVARKPRRREVSPEPDEDAATKPVPRASTNYRAFLKAMRPRWKARLTARHGGQADATMPAMFASARASTRSGHRWDIVQIRPTRHPGRFVMWVQVDTELASVPVRISREFYLHTRTPAPDDVFRKDVYGCERVVRGLPRGLPCTNLYKISVREDYFVEGQSHFIDLMNDPNVDNVYETKVPLVVRALLKLGNACSTTEPGLTLNMVRNTGLDLTKLDRSTSMSRQKYLDGGRAGKYLFLYHAFASGAGVHCFVLILSDGAMKLHIVDRSARRQPISRLEEAYQDLLEKRRNSHGKPVAMDYPSAVTPTYNYHGNETTALKALSRELGLLEGRGHTVVLSSMKEQSFFDTAVPKLDRFPVLSMPKTKTVHILDLFPWTTNVAQKLFSRYLSAGAWLDRSMALADYYQVPIGHLEADQPLFLSDLEFARRLVAEDMLLWWSPGDRPDLGGLEDDYRMTEEFPNTEFTSPGCYFNVCLEIAVRNLAVDAVLHSVVINELEGAGGATAFDSTSHMINEYAGGEAQRDLTLGESQVSPKMFSILRSMVKTWMVDKIKGNFESAANVAVDHFWRWVSSSAAQMYDPSIHRFVHGLMRKTFIQLLAEFRRLGSHVVYADLSRILLVTSKPPGTAHAYATYITTAVTANELFQHVYLNTERFYDFLLFMDPANLGGIVCEDPLAVETPEQLSMEMKWNIQTFLPPAIQNDFASAIRYFVIEMFRTRQRNGGNTRVPLRILQNGAPDATQADTAKTKEMDSFREFISRKLARKLLKIVGNVQERHRDTLIHGLGDPADWEFPLLPGSHLNFSNPVLELMKSICAALLLANDYTVELGLVRRSVLELVGVREFSQDAVFVNPCEPLRLANVPCRHCDSMQDFDFCRDPTLLPGQREVAPRWTCGSCGGEYDRTAIELALIGRVHDLERRFAQQDLRCAKCGQIRSDNLSRHCQCSGAYQLTVNKAEARRKLRTMVNVAIVHNLARLRECAQVLLEDWS